MKNDSTVRQTPVMKQYYDIKSKNHDAIILFRMGDFYETFDKDALITSDILGIVLTKRSNGKASNVNLAGFPYHSLDNYLPKYKYFVDSVNSRRCNYYTKKWAVNKLKSYSRSNQLSRFLLIENL